jgi:hypothetical protein
LPATIPVQSFETIARRRTQVIELFRRVDGEKLLLAFGDIRGRTKQEQEPNVEPA